MESRLPAMLADMAPPETLLALTGGNVFDGSGRPPSSATTVLIDRGRISRICPDGEGIPDGAQRVDVAGKFVMPGLIDAHAHLAMQEHRKNPPQPPKGAEPLRSGLSGHLIAHTLRRAVRMGVTTVRDVGAFGDVVFEARQAMRYGAFVGPRLLISGRIISPTSPGGRFFDGMYREADGADDIRRAVRQQIRAGADFVKIMSTGARSVELENPHPAQCTSDEMVAFVDEAHRQGYRTAAHCEGLGGTELAIVHGADTIEHGFYLNQRPDLLDRMAETGSILVPTLSFLHDVAEDGKWTDLLVDQGKYNVEQAHLTLAAARSHGVQIALGFDSPDVDRAAVELARMVDHGMSAAEALSAATLGSATALGINESVGALKPGMLADIAVVDGNPLQDHRHLQDPERIWLVIRNGHLVSGAATERSVVA